VREREREREITKWWYASDSANIQHSTFWGVTICPLSEVLYDLHTNMLGIVR
jgi:hypothetical protein